MAERSVRARRANMQLYAPQEVAAPAQAIQRGMGLLSNSMDRMSQFFNEQARMEAEIEGAQYGARNAPTAEQLQDAFQSGEELELPGGFGTVFDRAARKAALDITQNEVEFEARKRINEIITAATMNGTNPATILDDIDAVTHGFAATFDDSSPGVARKLRAGLSIWANSKMASYENSYLAEQKTKSQANLLSNMLSSFESFDTIIADGIPDGKPDPKTGVQPVRALNSNDLISLKADRINAARRAGFPASSLTTISNLFDKNIIEAANRVLIDSVLLGRDTRYAIKAIGEGRIDGLAAATQSAVATLRGQDLSFSDIAQEVQKRRINEIQYNEFEETEKNNNSEKLADINAAKALNAIYDGNAEDAIIFINFIKGSDPVRAALLKEKFLDAGGQRSKSSPEALSILAGLDSNIRIVDIETYGSELSLADQRKYFKRAEFYQNEEVQVALTFMKGELILPADLNTISKDNENYKKVAIYRKLEGRLIKAASDAKANRVEFDAFEVAQTLIEEQGEDFSGAIKTLQIKAANDIIRKINTLGNGDYDLQPDQFLETIDLLNQILSDKEQNNHGAYSRKIKDTTPESLRNLILSIQKAME